MSDILVQIKLSDLISLQQRIKQLESQLKIQADTPEIKTPPIKTPEIKTPSPKEEEFPFPDNYPTLGVGERRNFTQEQIRWIRTSKMDPVKMAEHFNVKLCTIYQIQNNITYKWVK